jgi:hypothetical protein
MPLEYLFNDDNTTNPQGDNGFTVTCRGNAYFKGFTVICCPFKEYGGKIVSLIILTIQFYILSVKNLHSLINGKWFIDKPYGHSLCLPYFQYWKERHSIKSGNGNRIFLFLKKSKLL